MQAQTEWKATHNSRQPAQTENHSDGPRHCAHDDRIDDEGDDSNPEPSISNCCDPDWRVGISHNRRRSNRCSRALGGGNGVQGAATAAAELRLDRIRRATLIAIQSCVHGGHRDEGCERCKPESPFFPPDRVASSSIRPITNPRAVSKSVVRSTLEASAIILPLLPHKY